MVVILKSNIEKYIENCRPTRGPSTTRDNQIPPRGHKKGQAFDEKKHKYTGASSHNVSFVKQSTVPARVSIIDSHNPNPTTAPRKKVMFADEKHNRASASGPRRRSMVYAGDAPPVSISETAKDTSRRLFGKVLWGVAARSCTNETINSMRVEIGSSAAGDKTGKRYGSSASRR